MKFRIILDVAMGKGSRNIQQDDASVSDISERGLLAVLSDGMGGMEEGEQFSHIATSEMMAAFMEDDPNADLCSRLERAYERARSKALEFSKEQQVDGGATVVAVLIRDGWCAFLSAGDSRIYLFRGGGIIQLNREQTFGKQLDELASLGRIPRDEAKNNIYRRALTNNLTEESEPSWDICAHPFSLQIGDRISLVSDGVFEALDDEKLTEILSAPGGRYAQRIIDAVQLRNMPRQDNFSAVVISVDEDDTSIANKGRC